MKQKHIPAVPTFTIFEYFADHAPRMQRRRANTPCSITRSHEFRRQVAAGVPLAVGSDVGPFPHGTQARELELMVSME